MFHHEQILFVDHILKQEINKKIKNTLRGHLSVEETQQTEPDLFQNTGQNITNTH